MTTIQEFAEINNIPYTDILVLIKNVNKQKYPIYERNNLSIEEIIERNKSGIIKNKNGRHTKIIFDNLDYVWLSTNEPRYKIKKDDKLIRTNSLYLKHTKNIYCIDVDQEFTNFDTFLDILDKDLKNLLTNCPYTTGNTKGFHIYVKINNVPEYTDQQDVYNCFKGDLLKQTNIWEFNHKLITVTQIPEYEFEQLKCLFNSKINKVKVSNNCIINQATMNVKQLYSALPREDYNFNELIEYIDLGLRFEIFKLMSGYTNWLYIGFIIYNNFADNGFCYFDMISKQYPSSTQYNQEEVKNKYFRDIKNSYKEESNKLTIKTLLKLYKDTDSIICSRIQQEFKKKFKSYIFKQEQEETKNKIKLIEDYVFDEIYLSKFNTNYFHSLDGYELKKKYFEIFVCKVLRPDTCYVYTEIDFGKFNCLITRDIELTFKHLTTGEIKIDQTGKKSKSFINCWTNDCNILTYNNMDFLPYNDCRYINTEMPIGQAQAKLTYNLFNGFNSLIKTTYPIDMKDKIIKPFKDLLYELVGADDNCFNYLYHYFGHLIQKPNERLPYAFIFKSKQGVGKNLLFDTIGNLIGSDHYKCSSNPNDFFGEYAEGFFRKLLVVLNECEVKNNFDFQGKIKSFITEDRITLNPKFIRATDVNNMARLFIFTNKPNPMNVDFRSIDRRWIVFQSTDKYLDNTIYNSIFWDKLVSHLKKPEFIAALYNDFISLNIDEFNFKNRPFTKAYYNLVKQYIPIESLFLENYIIHNSILFKTNAPFEKTKKELFEDFKQFCDDYGYDYKYQNIEKIDTNFRDLDIPFEYFKKTQIGFVYVFKLKDVHKLLVQKNHITRFDNEINDSNSECIFENKLHEKFEDYFY